MGKPRPGKVVWPRLHGGPQTGRYPRDCTFQTDIQLMLMSQKCVQCYLVTKLKVAYLFFTPSMVFSVIKEETLHNDKGINPTVGYNSHKFYAPSIGAHKYIKQTLTELKETAIQ